MRSCLAERFVLATLSGLVVACASDAGSPGDVAPETGRPGSDLPDGDAPDHPAADAEAADTSFEGPIPDGTSPDPSVPDPIFADPSPGDPGLTDPGWPTDGSALGWGPVRGVASARGVVSGVVTDVATGQPVADIWVGTLDGSARVRTDAAGTYRLDLPSGRAVIEVSDFDHVALRRVVGVGTQPQELDFAVQALGEGIQVDPLAGTQVDVGTARLAFPAGSYPPQLGVHVNWADGIALEASPGPLAFRDAMGGARRITGVLSVGAPVQPGQPVEVRLPVPEGVTPADVLLFELVDGAWANPSPPQKVEDGFAHYRVAHFSDKGQAVLSSPSLWVVLSAKGDIRKKDGTALAAGMVLATGDVIVTGETGRGHVQDPTQSLLYISPKSEVRLDYREDAGRKEYEASLAACLHGRLRAVVVSSDAGHTVKTPQGTGGVRGTVLTAGPADCPPGGDDPAACAIEVTEGSVEADFLGGAETVSSGESLGACPNVPPWPDAGPSGDVPADPGGPKDVAGDAFVPCSLTPEQCVVAPPFDKCFRSYLHPDCYCESESLCDDGDLCTNDTCNPFDGCVHTPTPGPGCT